MIIKKLFLHQQNLIEVEKLILTKDWIVWNKYWKQFSPRHILITSMQVYEKFWLDFETLKSNVIIDSWYKNLDSWDILIIWNAKIRLTYFCEGCYKLNLEKNILKNIWKERWILGTIIKSWEIKIWDKIEIEKSKFEKLPFETKDRFLILQKKLENLNKFISYSDTIFLLWLPKWFLRAIKWYKIKYNLENILEKEKIEKLEESKIFSAQDFYY